MYLSRLTSLLTLALVTVGHDVSIKGVEKAFSDANVRTPDTTVLTPRRTATSEPVSNPITLLEVSLPQASGLPITLRAGVHAFVKPSLRRTHVPKEFEEVGLPRTRQVRHFLGGDFFINHRGLLVNSMPAISEWKQPTPPVGSDSYRYIFLLFKQSEEFTTQTLINSATSIQHFTINSFALAVDLGDPIAGTFMFFPGSRPGHGDIEEAYGFPIVMEMF
ncbi:PEBP-like protein [Mycena venus]|uniref:PEBP-like protein n=1 Tax=Mycena venus TaxID=2733690 RepID=A0A8H6XVB5_9AGAR|nr:PEBP-like protein [Mycena venus]